MNDDNAVHSVVCRAQAQGRKHPRVDSGPGPFVTFSGPVAGGRRRAITTPDHAHRSSYRWRHSTPARVTS